MATQQTLKKFFRGLLPGVSDQRHIPIQLCRVAKNNIFRRVQNKAEKKDNVTMEELTCRSFLGIRFAIPIYGEGIWKKFLTKVFLK
ncbi:hypothetical protein [Paenibacillus sp. RS8]|uniref:hypothetical protein n=1 Tax=Paenibacillus sp. RS8 TaxID=3242681 RepID=UPI0035C26F47